MYMYVGLLTLLTMSMKWCGACRSTADCPVLPVPPRLTQDQVDILSNLYLKLKPLSCEELRETVYNITEPPIQLTAEQSRQLAEYYPTYFKKPVDQMDCGISTSRRCTTSTASSSVTGSVCATESTCPIYHVGIDSNGNPVYIPQLTGEDLTLVQQFEKYNCIKNFESCLSGLSCTCKEQLLHSNNAIVADISNGYDVLINSNITILDCAAYVN